MTSPAGVPPADTVAPAFDQELHAGIKAPPTSFLGILGSLGPGMVIAGSIVGSGELIATTKTGAQGGIALLWLIVLGCVVKVFAQIELGRHAITHGQTTLKALNTVPGRIGPVNFIVWFWLLMMLTSIVQMGAIVGGVGQSMAIALPITGDYRDAVLIPAQEEIKKYVEWADENPATMAKLAALSEAEQQRIVRGHTRIKEQLDGLGDRGTQALATVRSGGKLTDPPTWDDQIWALLLTVITAAMLYSGRYGIIEKLSVVLVVCFTFITIGNVIGLQVRPQWSIPLSDIAKGLMFRLPESGDLWVSLGTALATFGIIGVGASELIQYPYWCIEKGYARFAGKRTNDEAWAQRARGWMRVMHYDAGLSMVVYTLATLAFFMMGVAVLHREGRDPDGMRMVSTLSSMYVPIFGEYAKWLFLLGAFAVLYSTFLVANAGNARLWTDGCKLFGLIDPNSQRSHDMTLRFFCVALPAISCLLFWLGINPTAAVLLAGLTQAINLPMIGFGALWFRWTATDPRLKPSKAWDLALALSFVALLVVAVWGLYSNGQKAMSLFRPAAADKP